SSSFFFRAEDGIRARNVTGVQTCALPIFSETVPDGTVVEFLADYEQVVGKDGTIYQPLTEKEINLIYKVTKDGESAEGTVEHTEIGRASCREREENRIGVECKNR